LEKGELFDWLNDAYVKFYNLSEHVPVDEVITQA